MIKTKASAETIRREILRRFLQCDELAENCRNVDLPSLKQIDPAVNGGCNWAVDAFPGAAAECLPALEAIAAEMMREYELQGDE